MKPKRKIQNLTINMKLKLGYGTYGVIGSTGGAGGGSYASGFDEYGAAQKPSVSVATLGGTSLGTFSNSNKNTFTGDVNNRLDDCTCVRINQCASYDIVQSPSQGREIVQGIGTGTSGLVGYNIDPRSKANNFGTESNYTDSVSRSTRFANSEIVAEESQVVENSNLTEAEDNSNRTKRQTNAESVSSSLVTCYQYFV